MEEKNNFFITFDITFDVAESAGSADRCAGDELYAIISDNLQEHSTIFVHIPHCTYHMYASARENIFISASDIERNSP